MTDYKLGPIAAQLLTSIVEAPSGGLGIREIQTMDLYANPRHDNKTLRALAAGGFIVFMSAQKAWRATHMGKVLLSRKNGNAQGVCAKAEPRRVVGVGVYTGLELERNEARAGSGDAYALPSMFAGQRVPRRSAQTEQGGAA